MTNDYPSAGALQRIATWPCNDFHGLMEFVKDIWEYADCGYWTQKKNTYHISTGGWSGNEDIIEALQEHRLFWSLCWVRSERGGRYIFELRYI